MSRDMNDLVPEFKVKVEQLLSNCEKAGYIFKPFFTLRSPLEQAKLWRQSRDTSTINQKIQYLKSQGAPFLAECLIKAGVQNGRWVTNALPGYSWHNYGSAVDCYLVNPNGSANWDTSEHGYAIYAEEATRLGMRAGYFFKQSDAVHVQLWLEGVSKLHSLIEINKYMEHNFSYSIVKS